MFTTQIVLTSNCAMYSCQRGTVSKRELTSISLLTRSSTFQELPAALEQQVSQQVRMKQLSSTLLRGNSSESRLLHSRSHSSSSLKCSQHSKQCLCYVFESLNSGTIMKLLWAKSAELSLIAPRMRERYARWHETFAEVTESYLKTE